MSKKTWSKPQVKAMNNSIVKSANLMTALVYELVVYTVTNTATDGSGNDCTTYDGYMGTADFSSGYAPSESYGTFHIGTGNAGVISTAIACS